MKTAMVTFAPLSLKRYDLRGGLFTNLNDKRTTARHRRSDAGLRNHLVPRASDSIGGQASPAIWVGQRGPS